MVTLNDAAAGFCCRAENIKAITKFVKEQSSSGTEGRSETMIEAEKILTSLKQEYKQLVRNCF